MPVTACRWAPPSKPLVPIRRGLPSSSTASKDDARPRPPTSLPTPRLPRADPSTPHADPRLSATGEDGGGGTGLSETSNSVFSELDLEQDVIALPGTPAVEALPLAGLAYQLGHLALPTVSACVRDVGV